MYQQGHARSSGSPETSAFNTILTAAISYLAHRMSDYDPLQAWSNLGILGGDDSLLRGLPNVSPEQFAKTATAAARNLGQTLTLDIKHKFEPVSFLARIYGAAWFGDPNSMADPLRLLSKLHTSPNMVPGITPTMKANEKASSILLTDSETPIIGDAARKMLCSGASVKSIVAHTANTTWWSKFDASVQWPNVYASWMDDVIAVAMPNFDHLIFEDWIGSGQPLEPPTCLALPMKPGKIEVVVDGTIVDPISPERTTPLRV